MMNEPDVAQITAARGSPFPSDILLEYVSDAVVLLDAAWRFTYANPSAQRLLGHAASDLLGADLTTVFSRRLALPFMAAYDHALAAHEPAPFEQYYPPSQRWYRYRVLAARGGVAVLFHEVADRPAPQRQTRAQLDGPAALAAFGRDLADAGLDYDAVLQCAARRTAELLGDGCVIGLLAEDGQMVMPAVGYHADEDHRPSLESAQRTTPPLSDGLLLRLMLAGEPTLVRDPSWSETPSGVPAPYQSWFERDATHSLLMVPLRRGDKLVGGLALVRDQTPTPFVADDLQFAQALAERAALAIESARLYRQAQAALAAREQFLSIAAHELRTPLTTLAGYVFLLKRKLAANVAVDVAAAILAQMDQQCQRLDRLVNALLDVTRIDTDVFELARQDVDIVALVGQVVAEVTPQLRWHSVHLQAPAEPVMVYGDADRIVQVVQNVLQNAVKYYPAGGPILVSVRNHDGMARIAVRDQGIGIPPESQGRLFEQFYRAANVDARHINGLGVGLYVAQQIVARHGGSITVDSAVGRGSTFTICLPVAAT